MSDPVTREEFELTKEIRDQQHKENLERFKSVDNKLWGILLLILAGYATGIGMAVLHI